MIEWTGIEVLYWFQAVRDSVPFLQDFFLLVSSKSVYLALPMMVACFFYWMVDKRKGEIICLSFISSMVVATMVKFGMGQPRPWEIDPDIERVSSYDNDPSCPSGHTAITTSALGSAALLYGKSVFSAVMITVIVLTIFARLFLCVHTPLDIVAGLTVAVVVSILVWRAVDISYRDDRSFLLINISFAVMFAILFAVSYLLWQTPVDILLNDVGFVFGVVLGRLLEHRYVGYEAFKRSDRDVFVQYCVGMLIGAAILLVPHAVLPVIGGGIGGFLIMIWSFVIYPSVMMRRKKGKEEA